VKIAHVLPAFTRGGAERVVLDLANQAIADGHSVTIILAHPAAAELMPGRLSDEVSVRYVSRRSKEVAYASLPAWILRNWSWLRSQDVVHCHLTFGAIFGAILQALRRATGSRLPAVVETNHAVGMAISPYKRAFHAALLRRRDATVFMAEDSYWRGFMARHPQRLFAVIPNGLAGPGPIEPGTSERYRQALGLRNRPITIGSISRLVRERRPDLLLETFALLVKGHGVDADLVIGGEGQARHGLEAQATELQIEDRVHLPGLATDVTKLLGVMDLYLTVNVGPITGIAALEAALSGLPIVAIQFRGDYSPSADDWVWSSPEPAAVAAKIAELLANPGALSKLARTQQGYATTHFTIASAARSYYALYEAALAERATARQ